MANENYPPIRRVITGHDMNNVAKVMIDAPATNTKSPSAGIVSTLMWVTDGAPAKIPAGDKFEDMGTRIVGTAPAPKGTRFCVIDFPPGNHPGMHRTETVDYVIVLEGEIAIELDGKTYTACESDIVAIPSWVKKKVRATKDAIFFTMSDRAAQEKLGFYREERI